MAQPEYLLGFPGEDHSSKWVPNRQLCYTHVRPRQWLTSDGMLLYAVPALCWIQLVHVYLMHRAPNSHKTFRRTAVNPL
jgi:hypothetical protein